MGSVCSNLGKKSQDAANSVDISSKFMEYAKMADPKSDGKFINLQTSDKWMQQANLLNKDLTTTDTANAFAKLK